MPVYHHAFGDVILRTQSTVRLGALERAPFSGFAVEPSSPGLTCRYIGLPTSDEIDATRVVADRLRDVARRPDDHAVDRRPESVVIVDRSGRCADAYFRDGMSTMLAKAYVGPFLAAALLPELGAVLVHGACLDRNGEGLLLVAPDGGGKTTAARQHDGARVLGDDQILVHRRRDGFTASATPWGMMVDGPRSVKLRAVVLLDKAPVFQVTRVEPETVLGALWAEHQLVLPLVPTATRARLFELTSAVALQLPTVRMSFAPGQIRWHDLDRLLAR